MSRLKRLISEIHHRSLWQVLLIYIGAAWACFELIATVADTTGLPVWLPSLATVLSLLGLPVDRSIVIKGWYKGREHQAQPPRRPFAAASTAGNSGTTRLEVSGVPLEYLRK